MSLCPFLYSYLLWISFASAEVITVSREKSITCILTEDSVSSTMYLNPPVVSGFTKLQKETTKWITDDWKKVNSTDTNQNVVTDKRWEDFPILDEFNGYALENNSLPFSVCVTENFFLDIFSSDFVYEKWLHIAPSFLSFSENKNSCKWVHYSLTKEGSTVNLISSENKQTFDVGFEPYWIFPKSSTGKATFWKLHNYEFRASTTATQEQESKVSLNFTDNLCLSMYVSIDKNSFLDVILETTDNITKTTIIGFNENDDLKKWQKIEIEAPGFGEGNISFFRGLEQQGDQEGYWAIDEISLCNKEIEVLQALLENKAAGDYVCESLNQYDIPESKDQIMLGCNKPGFLGNNCNVSCEAVLGSNYTYCENHKICQDASCFCSWGFQGEQCSEQSVEALTTTVKESTLTEQDLPLHITIVTNQVHISLPSFQQNISGLSYDIKYICVSNWCKDQIVENYTINVPWRKLVIRKFENFVPLTEYRASVTVQRFNQYLEKRYDIIRTDDVYAVQNVSIYSSTFSSLWIRFRVSEVPTVGLPYKVWYQEINSESSPKSIDNVFPCDLWDNYICARIDNLKRVTFYSIMVQHVQTQYQKLGLSKASYGCTSEAESYAPENFKIRASSDGKAILSWDHPMITNGPISKFVIEVQTKEIGNSYTADIVEPQKTYTYKIPIEYNTEYTISISGFNKYGGEKSTITATFTRFTSSFSSDGTIIETCGERCLIMVPKPDDLQYTRNYRIVGIPGNDTSSNIQRMLNNKVEPSEQEWLNLEDTGLYEEYFTADIGTPSAKALSLHNIKNYSLYLVQKNNSNHYSIYPTQILEDEKSDSVAKILSILFVVIINIFGILLIIILALLLSRLNRRNHWERNNFYQESFKVEQSTLITEIETEKQFTKTQTRFLESILKNALLGGKTFIANLRSSSGSTRPMVHSFHSPGWVTFEKM